MDGRCGAEVGSGWAPLLGCVQDATTGLRCYWHAKVDLMAATGLPVADLGPDEDGWTSAIVVFGEEPKSSARRRAIWALRALLDVGA